MLAGELGYVVMFLASYFLQENTLWKSSDMIL